ncbi:hypothetical protein DRW07_01460 [Alteromonas sediminis]|uniref:Uncharacterized protein n=1 Tax=Alteromonas sediminis TaxID=2259342 RepID=A0A3N5Y2I7_9ALTE|nr:hypothetical protein [Alteromonas sediminis]RPJ68107.1 hypothetical protein DRW07_01460 [Alteromonas sediminis]
MLSLLWDIAYMSALVFVLGYGLHYIAYMKNLGNEADIVSAKYLKRDENGKKRKFKTGNALLDKWLDFGGGYYGIVAFIKLIFIEIAQVREFILEGPGIVAFLQSLGIGTIISFFIEQITNFVSAIIWPVNLIGRFSLLQAALFIVVTYYVCEWSRKLARQQVNKVLTVEE